MADNNDWRLRGQESYLLEKALYLRQFPVEKDHDHCEFCWTKFSHYPDALHQGYTTNDNYYWICPDCMHDFKVTFKWTIRKD